MADINLSAAAVAQLILSIGYAQQLNTTDKSTLVAAINEVLATAKAGGSPAADKVTYSGEIDGTTVANVKAALDALTARKTGASTASEVSYSGKIGAGEVDNVKQALDALAYGNPLDMSADFNDAQIGGPEEWPTQTDENDSTKYRIPAGEYLITASDTKMLYYRVMDTGTMRTVLLLDLSGSQDYFIELFQSAAPGEYTPMLKCEFDEQGRIDFYGYASFNGVNEWEKFPKLPDPINNSGKWLKSDGASATWENLPSSATPSAEDVTVAGSIGDAGNAPNTVTNVAQALEVLSFSQPLNLTTNFTNSGATSVAEWAVAGSDIYNIGEGYYVIGTTDTRYYVRILGTMAMTQRVVQIWKHGRVNIEPTFEVWQCTSPGSTPEMLLRYEAERGDLTIPNQRWNWQVPDYRDAEAEQVLMAPGDGRAPVWGNAPKPVFMVTATVSGATATFDKTLAEISEAYSAGNVVQATIANGDRAGAVLDLAICVPSTLAMFSTTIDMNTSILHLQVGITAAGAGFYEKSLSTEGLPAITAADKNKVLVAGDDGAEWQPSYGKLVVDYVHDESKIPADKPLLHPIAYDSATKIWTVDDTVDLTTLAEVGAQVATPYQLNVIDPAAQLSQNFNVNEWVTLGDGGAGSFKMTVLSANTFSGITPSVTPADFTKYILCPAITVNITMPTGLSNRIRMVWDGEFKGATRYATFGTTEWFDPNGATTIANIIGYQHRWGFYNHIVSDFVLEEGKIHGTVQQSYIAKQQSGYIAGVFYEKTAAYWPDMAISRYAHTYYLAMPYGGRLRIYDMGGDPL